MPRDGSGGYSPPQNSWNPAINSNSALPNDWMAILNDLAAAVQASIAADGQTPITGILNFGNNRLKNVGAPQGSGDGLRFEQLTKGADVPSAATIGFPIEGALFSITGTTAITAISGSFPGRMVLVKFADSLTLTHGTDLILPWGANITTQANDFAMLVCLDGTKWECWLYPKAAERKAEYDARWVGTPVGGYITPKVAPPKDDPRFRYVLCTAGEAGSGGYNEGVLTSESVTGTAPLIEATATVSLSGSPFNSETIHLINTEGRFPGPGEAEALENDLIQAHRHGATASFSKPGGSAVTNFIAAEADGPSGTFGIILDPSSYITATSLHVLTGGAQNGSTQPAVRAGNRTQPRTHRLAHYRRIK